MKRGQKVTLVLASPDGRHREEVPVVVMAVRGDRTDVQCRGGGWLTVPTEMLEVQGERN